MQRLPAFEDLRHLRVADGSGERALELEVGADATELDGEREVECERAKCFIRRRQVLFAPSQHALDEVVGGTERALLPLLRVHGVLFVAPLQRAVYLLWLRIRQRLALTSGGVVQLDGTIPRIDLGLEEGGY